MPIFFTANCMECSSKEYSEIAVSCNNSEWTYLCNSIPPTRKSESITVETLEHFVGNTHPEKITMYISVDITAASLGK